MWVFVSRPHAGATPPRPAAPAVPSIQRHPLRCATPTAPAPAPAPALRSYVIRSAVLLCCYATPSARSLHVVSCCLAMV